MIIKRPLHLLLLSACLVQSPAIFSGNDSADDNTADTASDAVQLSMLSGSEDELEQNELTLVDEIQNTNVQNRIERDAEEGAESDTEGNSAQQFSDEEIARLRQLFLQAEVAIENGNDAVYLQLSQQLHDYPLYPYLQYQWLKKHLDKDLLVKQFIEQHGTSRYARSLKLNRLYHLARNARWQDFLQSFDTSTRDASLNCYYRRAQFNTGDKQAALAGAKDLWAVGKSQPKACDPLFAELKKSSHFNRDLFWQRFDAALRNNKTRLARYVKKLMPAADQEIAALWLKLHDNPDRYLPELLSRAWTAQSKLMFTHAIDRLASSDINQAIEIWDKHKQRYNLSTAQTDRLEKRLAFKLAYENDAAAYERLGQLNDSDNSSKTIRIRVALSEQNWPRVITAIEDLNPANKQTEKWQYWLARAYYETGKPLQAEEILSDLSVKRDFYGYLAADRLNRLYQLSDNPIEATSEQLGRIKNHQAFRVAFEFMVLERERDAKLQWWHALRQLDKADYPVAAKLAQQWQWDEIAIFTIAKVKQWDDIEMRFPMSYADKIHENAELQNLNPVILFGLIRRESAFNKDARSPSGAQGLMQIMPQTARQIAKDLDERYPGRNGLYDPVKNLQYGSYYYQKLLNQFDGHYAIALAAYNAGPNRVKKWLPDETIPADIWIETIPFRETRNYVTSVLVYALIYQQRIQTNELTMNDLTREVQPLLPSELTMNQLTPDVQPLVMMP